jgi:large subunit ribosomal protein L25
MQKLEVQERNDESADALRERGFIPAVFYGPKEKSTPISVSQKQFEHVFRDAGETTIVKLSGVDGEKDTLIRDVQFHPVTDRAMHADFYVLEAGKKVTINVPLEFVGEAPAEKAGHILVKALHEIEIEVAPAELPHHLDVDISKLENVGDHILVSDIVLPKSAELKTGAEEIVASVTAFVEEKPLETEVKLAEVGEAPAEAGAESAGAEAAGGAKAE